MRRRNTSGLDRVAATSTADVRAQAPPITAASRGSSVQGHGIHPGRKAEISIEFSWLNTELSKTAQDCGRTAACHSPVIRHCYRKVVIGLVFSSLLSHKLAKSLTNPPASA
jgi:hypothetical protein